jgi:hypothetical protein
VQETEERLMILYLLGELDEAERERVEERYQADDDFYLRLRVAEDGLLDSYAAGELSGIDLERFERAYLTNPARLRKVEANRELLDLIARQSAPPASRLRGFVGSLLRAVPGRNMSLQYSLAGLLLLAVCAGLLWWLFAERSRARGELEQARSEWQQKEEEYRRRLAESEHTAPAPAPAQTPTAVPTPGERVEQARQSPKHDGPGAEGESRRAASAVVAFMLLRGGVRTPDGDPRSHSSLVIPRAAVVVRLTLSLERNQYPGYQVSILKVGGDGHWNQTLPKGRQGASSERVTFDVPASFFQSGDYIVKVTGSNPSGEEEILAFQQINALNLKRRTEEKP